MAELSNGLPVMEVGGKAHSLSVLLEHDFNVPQGFVIASSAFYKFLEWNNLLVKIQRLSEEITENNFRGKSAQAKEEILKGKIPVSIASELDGLLNRLGVKYVSIRSSSVTEDSLGSSFAGLFDTFLNIRAELPLIFENIKKCWASLFNERAVAYRIRKGIPHLEGMAVIIQTMAFPEVSGVTFTVHPLNKDALLIEAAYGIGDLIVGGKIDPDDFALDRETLAVLNRRIGDKKRMSICKGGELKTIDVEPDMAERQVLPDEVLKKIAKICLKVEKIFDYPQDIEWCLHQSKIWLLQSRPITEIAR